MKDVHCIDQPLSFKLPINHGKQTVKLKIDFCQQVTSSLEKERNQGEQRPADSLSTGARGAVARMLQSPGAPFLTEMSA